MFIYDARIGKGLSNFFEITYFEFAIYIILLALKLERTLTRHDAWAHALFDLQACILTALKKKNCL